MAKNDIIDVPTAAEAGVTIKRWWKSGEIFNYSVGMMVAVISLGALIAPSLLPILPTLNLSPWQYAVAVLVLQLLIHGGGMVLKMRSTTVIGGKVDVAQAKAVTDDQPVAGRGSDGN